MIKKTHLTTVITLSTNIEGAKNASSKRNSISSPFATMRL